jgi:hypothetical protein
MSSSKPMATVEVSDLRGYSEMIEIIGQRCSRAETREDIQDVIADLLDITQTLREEIRSGIKVIPVSTKYT